ncbi:MAG: Bug family tripartite tricarboxylate transporter substrate binding protein [Burkholderiaceae bacterium]
MLASASADSSAGRRAAAGHAGGSWISPVLGKIRALAVTGKRRLAALPDVPTLAEQGVPGVEVNSWWGFVGPAGMSKTIVAKLHAEIAQALADPELKKAFAAMNVESTAESPEAFGAYIAQEAARWKETAAKSGLKLE